MVTIEYPANATIHKFTYDHLNQTLTVYYQSGEIKYFDDISTDLYSELCEAVDPAVYIERHLRYRPLNTKERLAKRRAEHNKQVLLNYNLRRTPK